MNKLFIKYCLSILLSFCVIVGYAQSRDLPTKQKPGACYAKCLISKNKDTKNFSSELKEYPVYIGSTPDKVKTKTITIEIKPPMQTWIREIKSNCESKNEEDCLLWSLTDTPGEYMELEVLKNKRKLKEEDWAYREVELFMSDNSAKAAVENSTDWREVLCASKMSKEFIKDLKKELADRGFEHDSETQNYDARTKSAVKKYQQYNELPIGQLNFETIEKLGLARYL